MEIAQLLSRATGEGDYSAYVASAAAKYLLDFERTDDADAGGRRRSLVKRARTRGRTRAHGGLEYSFCKQIG